MVITRPLQPAIASLLVQLIRSPKSSRDMRLRAEICLYAFEFPELFCPRTLGEVVGDSAKKVRRAQILLKSDADGPAWTDLAISAAFNCRTRTIENLRQRVLVDGFALALHGKQRENSPTPPKLDGQGEAKLIAMRLGKPPVGYGRWTLQLLAEQMVTLDIVDRICAETVRKTLKKTR